MKFRSVFALLIHAVLSACGPASTPTSVPDALFADPREDLGPISPYLYGTNFGPMHAVTLDVMPLVEDADFKALRFPGGA